MMAGLHKVRTLVCRSEGQLVHGHMSCSNLEPYALRSLIHQLLKRLASGAQLAQGFRREML